MSALIEYRGRAYVAVEPAGDALRVQCVHCSALYNASTLDNAIGPEGSLTWQCTSGQCFGRVPRWREIVSTEEQLRRTIEKTNALIERLAPAQQPGSWGARVASEQIARVLLTITELWPGYQLTFAKDSDLSSDVVGLILEKLHRAHMWEQEKGFTDGR